MIAIHVYAIGSLSLVNRTSKSDLCHTLSCVIHFGSHHQSRSLKGLKLVSHDCSISFRLYSDHSLSSHASHLHCVGLIRQISALHVRRPVVFHASTPEAIAGLVVSQMMPLSFVSSRIAYLVAMRAENPSRSKLESVCLRPVSKYCSRHSAAARFQSPFPAFDRLAFQKYFLPSKVHLISIGKA